MKPFRAQRGANFFDFRFTFVRKLKHFRAQRGAKFFDFSSIRAKNNFELTFHNSFIAHHAPGIINNFFHNGKPAGRINYYYESSAIRIAAESTARKAAATRGRILAQKGSLQWNRRAARSDISRRAISLLRRLRRNFRFLNRNFSLPIIDDAK